MEPAEGSMYKGNWAIYDAWLNEQGERCAQLREHEPEMACACVMRHSTKIRCRELFIQRQEWLIKQINRQESALLAGWQADVAQLCADLRAEHEAHVKDMRA